MPSSHKTLNDDIYYWLCTSYLGLLQGQHGTSDKLAGATENE